MKVEIDEELKEKLLKVLEENLEGGYDVVWGPELPTKENKHIESEQDVNNFVAKIGRITPLSNKLYIWKIGFLDESNLTNSILPSKECVEEFKRQLEDVPGYHVVWGPELSVEVKEI